MADLTLEQIQNLTGHENADAVRMALKRAGVKHTGFAFGTNTWPPKKIYSKDDVWRTFGTRILQHAGDDAGVKERCWKVFRTNIADAVHGQMAGELFADRLT